MARQVHYNAAEHISEETAKDPYLRPAFPRRDRIRRLVWNICWALFTGCHRGRFMHGGRCCFACSARRWDRDATSYPGSRVWAPWNLVCADQVTAGDGAEIYNPAPVRLGSHAIVSQDAYLCGATHDFDDPAFPLLAYTMEVGAYAWVCARACVGPG